MQPANPGMSGGAAVAAALETEHTVIHEMWRDLRNAANPADWPAFIAPLDAFMAICGTHFQHEEESLLRHREMAFRKHMAGHQELLGRLRALRSEITEATNPNVARALADWWIAFSNHIDDCDRPALERLVSGDPEAPPSDRIWRSPERRDLRS